MTLNKYTLSLMMAISFSFPSIPTIGMEDPREVVENSAIPQRILSVREALEDAARLFNLCDAGKYEEALQKAFPEPVIAADIQLIDGQQKMTGFTQGDMEQYYFCRLCALAMISNHKGKKEQLNPDIAIKHYRVSLHYLNTYLSSPIFGISFVSQYQNINNRVNDHRVVAYLQSSDTSSQIAHLLIKQNMPDSEKTLPKELLCSSIALRKEAILFMEGSLLLSQEEDILKQKLNLFQEYITLIHLYSPTEGKEFLKEAKILHHEFQKNKSPGATPHKRKTSQMLKLLEKRQEMERNRALATKSGPKLTEFRQKKHAQYAANLSEMVRTANADSNGEDMYPLQHKIIEAHQNFHSLANNSFQNSKLIPLLKEIEGKIHQELIESLSPSTLFDIYQKYEVFLGGEILRKQIVSHILPTFLYAGDIEGALERVIILAQLEQKKLGNNSLLTLCMRAAIKNMNGDHEEWEAFEQKLISTHKQGQEKKKDAKKRKQQQHVAQIKEHQESLPSPDSKSEHKEEVRPQTQTTTTTTTTTTPQSETSVDPKVEKEERRKRHEEAEIRRAEQRKHLASLGIEPDAQTTTTTTTTTPITPPDSEDEDSDLRIRDFFQLTSGAMDVDEEIENNTWKFTRDELMNYFQSMGCDDKEGAKHKKQPFLPKAFIISYEGTTITILNDLGGALSLPRWDGSTGNGTVPHYLRKQILTARDKLLALALSKLEEVKTTTQQPTP